MFTRFSLVLVPVTYAGSESGEREIIVACRYWLVFEATPILIAIIACQHPSGPRFSVNSDDVNVWIVANSNFKSVDTESNGAL